MQASDLERKQTRPKGWEELSGSRPAPPGAGRSWAVQVLATPNEREALLLVQKLEAAGYPVFVTPTRKEGLTWHRVRVGTYGAQAEAKTVARELQRRFELPTWVLE
jgi:cell division septation protein DedD